MTMETTARKLGTSDLARTGIHLVYSRSWTYQQRPHAVQGGRLKRVEEPQRKVHPGLLFTALALIAPGVWAFHSIFHSLHLI